MARTFTLKIEGKEYEVDDLTLDEMAQVEELAGGVPFSDLNFGAAQTMKALAYTLRRRDQPDVTMEQIGQLKMLELVAGDEEMPASARVSVGSGLPPTELLRGMGVTSTSGRPCPARSLWISSCPLRSLALRHREKRYYVR